MTIQRRRFGGSGLMSSAIVAQKIVRLDLWIRLRHLKTVLDDEHTRRELHVTVRENEIASGRRVGPMGTPHEHVYSWAGTLERARVVATEVQHIRWKDSRPEAARLAVWLKAL